jgi:protein-tyrosine-phosphatase
MQEIGVDISGHRAKTLDDLLDTSFDLIVTLSPEAHHQAQEWSRTRATDVVFWPTYDPSALEGNRDTRLAAYRDVRNSTAALIDHLFSEMGARG